MDVLRKESDKVFKVVSYTLLLWSLLALIGAGGVSFVGGIGFLFFIFLAWYIEDTKYQISEKTSVILIIFLLPILYLDWRFQIVSSNARDVILGGSLTKLIVLLGIIKLLQKKTDRDWLIIYLISFFQVLLSAGMGISPLFLISVSGYILFAFAAIILFEIKKSSSYIESKNNSKFSAYRNFFENNLAHFRKFSLMSFALLVVVSVVAVPLFLMFPRTGGGKFGTGLNQLSGFTGFSDSVRLGSTGTLQQSDEIVMRVRIDKMDKLGGQVLRWRGVALDNFENQTWRKSKLAYLENIQKSDGDFFLLNSTKNPENIVSQTVFLEPIDTPVLFGLGRPVAVQGQFQSVSRDSEGSIAVVRSGWERINYKIHSDISAPQSDVLREDNKLYGANYQKYLQLPKLLDPNISELTKQITEQENARNRYDQARVVERYLQTQFGYTLEMKAGGADPLSDFLFNVREGHCEYFASAMAVMLRTQGIAARVVNGFQQGEFNDTAGIYVIRQRDAHSWVEVYFPETNSWIPFDPTPAAGQPAERAQTSFQDKLKYFAETLETYWIEYVVSYDSQGQRSLFKSVRDEIAEKRQEFSAWLNEFQEKIKSWYRDLSGERGAASRISAIAYAVGALALLVILIIGAIYLKKNKSVSKLIQRFKKVVRRKDERSVIVFYQRMLNILAKRGIRREHHQTPLEFAYKLNIPEAILITETYNQVRFGGKDLTENEKQSIENWLQNLEETANAQIVTV